ncbi:MAG: HIT domain-containing protein [Anaerolineae bacterium]
MAYIKGEKKPVQGCVFCNLLHDPNEQQIIARSAHVFVTLNIYPYNNGHLMVIPNEHVDSQEKLAPEVLTDLILTINKGLAVLRKAYNPPAFNLGANIGAAAGAGVAEHYHFHIVPRWGGDANFMTTIGSTRVIPDTLDNTYRDLKSVWQDLYPSDVR